MEKFTVKDIIKCIKTERLPGNEFKPPLELNKLYQVIEIILDSAGNQHLDVGLKSKLNWIRSWDTKEELPRGETIHWCHPSRFEKIKAEN